MPKSLILCAALILVGQPAAADVLSEIKAGKIVVGSLPASGVKPGRAIGIVDAPASVVEQILSGFAVYKEFVPRCVGSRRVKPDAFVVESDLPWPVGRTWVYVKVQTGKGVLRWRMLNGTLKHYEGVAWVQPYGEERSVLTYQMLAVPHTVAPDALMSYGLREAVKEMVEAIRERAAVVLAQRPATGPRVASQ